MLKIIRAMNQLDFEQMMCIYQESNHKKGESNWKTEQEAYAYLQELLLDKRGFCAIWEVDGRYVTALRIERFKDDAWLLTALETLPTARKRGYAKSLIREVAQYLKENGAGKLYSHVEKRNVISLVVHKSCGFKEVLQHAVLLDGTVTQRYVTLCLDFS